MNTTQNTKNLIGQTVTAWNSGCGEVSGTVVGIDTNWINVSWAGNGKSYVGNFTNWATA